MLIGGFMGVLGFTAVQNRQADGPVLFLIGVGLLALGVYLWWRSPRQRRETGRFRILRRKGQIDEEEGDLPRDQPDRSRHGEREKRRR
jgi:sulfite exporter TauE/SafE